MFGRVIGTSIAVDWFQGVTKDGMFFLSEGNLRDPVPDYVDRIYTSVINAELIRSKYQLGPDRVVGLPLNERLLIEDKVKKLSFFVTLFGAEQKPGAVMFLFEGDDIGNVLYAGKCCYTDNLLRQPLSSFLQSQVLDYLYVHDACADCHNHSMSPAAAVEYIIDMIRRKPSCKVIIREPYFREDILAELKMKYRKPICVSEKIMNHLDKKGRGSDFSLDQSSAQVCIIDQPHDQISQDTTGHSLRVILIPCSMKRSTKEVQDKLIKIKNKGYRVILYRNHCSPPELVSLVHDLSAKHTVLLRPQPSGAPCSDRKKDLNFWMHLGNFNKFIEFFSMLEQEIKVPMEVDDVEAVDAEITPQSSVDCIAMNSDFETINSKAKNNEDRLERTMNSDLQNIECSKNNFSKESLILIESDDVSAVSIETVINPNVIRLLNKLP